MSKKKFKKKFRAEIHQQIQKLDQEPKVNKAVDIPSATISPEQLKEQSPSVVSEAVKKTNISTKSEDFSYVKNDIKRIGIIFTSVLILLVVIYFISIKTSWTINISDWIAGVLHIF